MKTNEDVYKEYTESLVKHIDAVRKFGRKLGIAEEQLQKHDLSKWDEEEFYPYAHWFYGEKENDLFHPTKMLNAWLRHLHLNPHHWQYWMYPDEWIPQGADISYGKLKMPEKYVLEMVADWHGASYAYTGSWDIYDWLEKNWGKINLHIDSAVFLIDVLKDLDYDMERWTK